jgi:hypothetical protein
MRKPQEWRQFMKRPGWVLKIAAIANAIFLVVTFVGCPGPTAPWFLTTTHARREHFERIPPNPDPSEQRAFVPSTACVSIPLPPLPNPEVSDPNAKADQQHR